jgi:hypothetical protein
MAGGVAIGKKLNVCGDTKIFSNTASTNTTSGALQLVGGAGIGGALNVGGTLGVTGNATLGGTLGVTGNTTLGGTLSITGETTLASAIVSDLTDGRVVLAGTSGALEDSANLTFDGSTLAVTGAQTISTTLTVTGNASFNGGVTLGNLSTGDDVNITGRVTSPLNEAFPVTVKVVLIV